MKSHFRQVGFEHIEVHLTSLELFHNFLLKFLDLRHQIEEVIGSEEGEVEVTCTHSSRSGVLQRLSKEIERIRVDAVVAHLQFEHINMRIHLEELIHIVGELHGARSTGRQDILAEAHALHISKRQIQIQHTLNQVPLQGAVKGKVCLHLVVVCRQSQL